MPETTKTTPSQAKPGRLTTSQMLHLMRLEVDRACRTNTPISCIVACVDRMERRADDELRRSVVPALFRQLKAVTFEADARGLGLYTGGFVLAVFPQTRPGELAAIGNALLVRAKELSHSDVAPGRAVSVSVGVAHNQHEAGDSATLESLIEEAEQGLTVAQEGGGDRCVQWRDVESEVDRLRGELDQQLEQLEEHRAAFEKVADGEDEGWGAGLIDDVIKLFQDDVQPTEATITLEAHVVGLINQHADRWRNGSIMRRMLESQSEIEQLERRLSKLTETLGQTEAELKRVAAMKSVDLGVASIYRTVQGLSDEAENAALKREMLKDIFEANLALREDGAAKE